MAKLVLKTLLVSAIAFAIFLMVVFILNDVPLKRNDGKTGFGETRAFNLTAKPQHYDVLIVGSSKAILFNENVNNDSISIILGKSVTNISHVGAGIIPMNVMLRYFYETGNTADHIIRFVDTHEFYSRFANEECDFLNHEPFNFDLLSLAYEEGVLPKRFFGYAQSKYRMAWLDMKVPLPNIRFTDQMTAIDSAGIAKRMEILYPDSARQEYFDKYSSRFLHFIDIAESHNSKVTNVFLPHVLGPQPGHEVVVAFLQTLKDEKGIEYYDYSQAVDDVSLFSNHDHLNTMGTVYVMKNFLKPIVNK